VPSRPFPPSPRSAAAALAAAGLLLLTACGGQEPAAAPSASSVAPSAALSASSAPAESELSAVQLVAQSSDAAAEAGSARLTLTSVTKSKAVSQRVRGSGLLDLEEQASQLELGLGGKGKVETRTVDGKTYLRGLGLGGSKWVVVPTTGAGQSPGSTDPTQLLSLLRRVSDDVREDGPAQVHGVRTTRYTGTLDLGKAVEQQGGAQADELQKAFSSLGIDAVPFELHLDEKGLPARYAVDLDFEVSGQRVRSATTLDFTDWGTDVDIEAPAASEISDEPLPGVGTKTS